MSAPIYVVVCSTGGMPRHHRDEKGGPIVMETTVDGATLDAARARAAQLERQFGASRVGRVVFEDEPGFTPAAA